MAQVGLRDLHFAFLTADSKEELVYEEPGNHRWGHQCYY